MGKGFWAFLRFTLLLFVILAFIFYFYGVENWLLRTLSFVYPAAAGYFFGYKEAKK